MSVSSLSSVSDVDKRRRRPRNFPAERTDLFSEFDEHEFRIKYRVTKKTALQICQRLDLEPFTQRNKPVSALSQLLVCLRFFADGTFKDMLGDMTNIHKSTVCRVLQRVTLELAKLSSVYIKMPEGEELQTVAEEFHAIDGFPRVVGIVDSTHINIINRGNALSETFRNREGFLSINIQIVCDASLRIRDLIARWPGSVQDWKIFNNSHLYADFEAGKYGSYHLLGDSSYCNKNYLLTPISQPQSEAQNGYNHCHSATHSTVLNCLRVWKQRCPCIQKGVSLRKTSTVLQVIVAAAVLHNMCIELGEPEPPDDFLVPDPLDVPFAQAELYQETSARDQLIDTLFRC